MHTSAKKFVTQAIFKNITVQINSHGVPTISASSREYLCFGIGYAHAWDRLVQMMLVRAIAQGRASEKFVGSDELIAVNKFMSWIHFETDIESEIEKLDINIRIELEAYCEGIKCLPH